VGIFSGAANTERFIAAGVNTALMSSRLVIHAVAPL